MVWSNFNISTGSSGTFDESSGDMRCIKDHFENKQTIFPSYDEENLRSIIFKAEKCKDYNQVNINKWELSLKYQTILN